MEKGAEATGNSLSAKVDPNLERFVKKEHPEEILPQEHHVGESVEHPTEPAGLITNIRSSSDAIKKQEGEDSTSSIRFLRVKQFFDKERKLKHAA